MKKESDNHIQYNVDNISHKIFINDYNHAIKKPIKWKIKRFIDISHSLIGITLLLPAFIIIPLLIRTESKGDVIFKQQRMGMHGKMFTMYKFRTMYKNDDTNKVENINDYRITKFGKFLRKYSLDEIPQLFNILRGDMSLVGPRPMRKEIFKQIQSVEPEYELRIATTPGLRLNIGRQDGGAGPHMAKIEREYIENWSLMSDLRIFLHIIYDTLNGKNY
jgi:lipopolysaccharide/colanic/teichoic acid biosynthesis glycosyltransferase